MSFPIPDNVEIWKDIPGFEGRYQASTLGDIKSLKRIVLHKNGIRTTVNEKILKTHLNHKGYVLVTIYIKNKRYTQSVHRIIMSTFEGESDLQVNHKKGIKTDNRFNELEYNTLRENMNHRYTTLNKRKRYGVHLHKSVGRWAAKIEVNRKQKHLGIFDDKEDAYEAFYNAYVQAYNIPPWEKK